MHAIEHKDEHMLWLGLGNSGCSITSASDMPWTNIVIFYVVLDSLIKLEM
jgi:hypothetical protein